MPKATVATITCKQSRCNSKGLHDTILVILCYLHMYIHCTCTLCRNFGTTKIHQKWQKRLDFYNFFTKSWPKTLHYSTVSLAKFYQND